MLEYAFRSVGKQLQVLRFIQDVTQSGDLKNGEGSKKVGKDDCMVNFQIRKFTMGLIKPFKQSN